MVTETRFPQHIDSPPVLLMFEVDEIIPFIIFFVLFLPTKNFLWVGIVLGVQASKIYMKIKRDLPNALFFHLLWMFGVFRPKLKNKATRVIPGYISSYAE